MKPATATIAAMTAAAWASTAPAAFVDVSFRNITKGTTAPVEQQLRMTVSDVPGQPNKVDFTFRNLVGTTSSIKEVFFDAGAPGGLLVGGSIFGQKGSSFTWGPGGAEDLPGGNALSPAFVSTVGMRIHAGSAGPASGLDQVSDSLVVRMTIADDHDFNDIVNALTDVPLKAGIIRVGLNVESIGGTSQSDAFVSNFVVPLPPAAWGGLSGLALVIGAGVVRSRALRRRD